MLGTDISGGADVYRQNAICPNHGLSSLEHISSYCRPVWRRLSYSYFPLRRAISYPGVCPVDLSGETARYRGLLVGSGVEALPYGHQRIDIPVDSGRCKRIPRLAHLRRFCAEADCSSKKALCWRGTRSQSFQHGLCAGLYNYRPLSFCISMGSIPRCKSSSQSSYTPGSQRRNTQFHSHHRRQVARYQYTRSSYSGSRGVLHHGSGTHRLRSTLYAAQSRKFFRDPNKVEPQRKARLLRPCGPYHRHYMRPDRYVERVLQSLPLPRIFEPYPLQRYREGQDAYFSNQQHHFATTHNIRSLQKPLADRTVLQMDQTAPSYQAILWHVGKCSENSNLDRSFRVCAHRNHQKKAQSRSFPLYIVTDSLGYPFREKMPLQQALQTTGERSSLLENRNQLNLFNS